MGNLCCISLEEDESEQNRYNYINKNYIKIHNDIKEEILINTSTDIKIWVKVSKKDYKKYKNNSDKIIYGISLENNELLNINKGDIILITLNNDLAPELHI